MEGSCIQCGKWLGWYDTKLQADDGRVACDDHIGGLNQMYQTAVCDTYGRIYTDQFAGFKYFTDG
jgi:hypothetical protein